MSLPTKMFLTFLLVKREQQQNSVNDNIKDHKSDAS
jgi:hypothetical protein